MNDVARLAEKVSHTPGPWVSFYKDKYKEWHVGVPVSSGSMKLALFPDGCPTENPGPDCRLIAAAPDMLAALKAMDVALCDGFDTQSTRMAGRKAVIAARAAIAKAEGRS
jgi:hypothetical protein